MASTTARKKPNEQLRSFLVRAVLVVVIIAAQPFLWSFVKSKAADLQDKRSQVQQISEVKKRNQAISQNIILAEQVKIFIFER